MGLFRGSCGFLAGIDYLNHLKLSEKDAKYVDRKLRTCTFISIKEKFIFSTPSSVLNFKKETLITEKKDCAKIDCQNFQFLLKLLFVLQS